MHYTGDVEHIISPVCVTLMCCWGRFRPLRGAVNLATTFSVSANGMIFGDKSYFEEML